MSGRKVTRLVRGEGGVALVEFALVAREGARWAVVNRNPATSGSLQNYIKNQADTTQLQNGATVVINTCDADSSGTVGVGDPVKVRVSYTYNWLPFITISAALSPTTTLTGTATMRLEQAPSNYTPD